MFWIKLTKKWAPDMNFQCNFDNFLSGGILLCRMSVIVPNYLRLWGFEKDIDTWYLEAWNCDISFFFLQFCLHTSLAHYDFATWKSRSQA